MDTRWIDQPDELQDFCESIEEGPVAVDSESDHFHAYRARVCLLQVATRQQSVLIDPLALEEDDLAPLFELFEEPGIVKILHSARNDINEFDRDWGVGIASLFDTQIAARFLGYRRNSLDWLVEEVVGEKPPKSFRRYDWTIRPLSEQARIYAATDVIHLFPLYDRFGPELDASQWRGPFDQQCRYVAEETTHQPNDFEPEGWREINEGRRLEGRRQAAFRALYLWRHHLCMERNEAAIHVFPNDAMAEVARRLPESADELTGSDRLPDELLETHGEEMVELVGQAEVSDVPEEVDDREADDGGAPSRAERARYNEMRRWRNRTADELDIPTEFVATNATLEEIAADPPSEVEELERFRPILPWHRQLFGEEIVRLANAT